MFVLFLSHSFFSTHPQPKKKKKRKQKLLKKEPKKQREKQKTNKKPQRISSGKLNGRFSKLSALTVIHHCKLFFLGSSWIMTYSTLCQTWRIVLLSDLHCIVDRGSDWWLTDGWTRSGQGIAVGTQLVWVSLWPFHRLSFLHFKIKSM